MATKIRKITLQDLLRQQQEEAHIARLRAEYPGMNRRARRQVNSKTWWRKFDLGRLQASDHNIFSRSMPTQ